MRSCTGISTSVRSSPPRALYFCVLPCGASLTGLCAVRAYKDLVLRCTVRAPRAFVRCEPTKALRFCVPYDRQELCAVRAYKGFVPLCTVQAPRALRGASLQRICASVCCKSFTSFVRCEPTKAFYRVLVLAPQDLLCARVQEPVYMYCASSHDICCSVREPVCLYVAERSIHVD